MAHLNSGFGQVDFQGHLLSHENIRVSGLGKQILQYIQLSAGEGGSLSSLFAGIRCNKEKNKQFLFLFFVKLLHRFTLKSCIISNNNNSVKKVVCAYSGIPQKDGGGPWWPH